MVDIISRACGEYSLVNLRSILVKTSLPHRVTEGQSHNPDHAGFEMMSARDTLTANHEWR
ncbi:hypothetical protein T10_4030 [Trichinella papuae]|uniref:Uncharacterized protein n=1 Tax=Trichinella papuae TaxID=268474 RepID=A0A0V1LXJ4_9BILA|nr:hypothetical protein T10_4030 [Trichinella papuae]